MDSTANSTSEIKSRFIPSQIVGYNWPSLLWLSAMHIGALASLFYFSKANLIAEVIMYFITGCLGITLGYHRMMAHRAVGVPKWLERILVTCGALAMEGGPIKWCAQHRMHHANPDTEQDPHNSRFGFFYCHVGWALRSRPFFDNPDKLRRFARDINQDRYYRWLDTTMGQFLPQLALAFVLFAIGGISMVLWGVCLRMVLVYHATWCVNSATHFFGYRNYDVGDRARNTWWVALISFGEGWHNNHHAYQNVVEAGHKWWEIDFTMIVVRILDAAGLVTKLNSIRDIKIKNHIDHKALVSRAS